MDIQEQIKKYIADQTEPKRSEMQELHELILGISPGCKLWFTDGKNDEGKIVSNPNIGYGFYTIKYADGTSREFYRILNELNRDALLTSFYIEEGKQSLNLISSALSFVYDRVGFTKFVETLDAETRDGLEKLREFAL